MWQRLLQIKTQLLAHEGFRRYGANTAWLMGEKILRMFIGLFVGIWVARYLGPEQFGLLSYAQSFVFLFTAVATLGLDSIVVRELVRDESERDVLLGTSFTLKLIGSICILPLLWVAVQFTSNDSYSNLLIFIIASGTIFQSFNVIDFHYQSTVKSKYVALANTITLGLSSIIKIVLILNHASLTAFAIVGVFDSAILSIGLIYFYITKTKYSLKNWKFDEDIAKRLLSDSWPLILSSVMVSLYMKIDQVMIKEMMDSNAVGQYAAAVRINEALYFIPLVIASSMFPSIMNAKKSSNNLYDLRFQRLYNLLTLFGVVMSTILFLSSSLVIKILYGEQYLESVDILKILSFMSILICISSVHSKWLIVENLQEYSLYYSIVGATANILANLYFIPKYGIKGAIYGSYCAQLIPYLLLLRNYKTKKQLIMIIKSFLPLGLLNFMVKNGISNR